MGKRETKANIYESPMDEIKNTPLFATQRTRAESQARRILGEINNFLNGYIRHRPRPDTIYRGHTSPQP